MYLGFFLWSCMDVRVGLWRRLSTEELMCLNCGVGEDSWECKEIHPVNPKQNLSWIFIGRTNSLATWCKELSHWIRPWCWERFKAGGEGDDRGWDIWTASPSQWTWVWASSRSSQWTRKPGVLQYMGSQRVRHIEQLNWTELSMWQCLCLAGSKIRRWTFAPSESFSNKEQ